MLVYGIISSHPELNTREIANLLSIKKTSVENAVKLLKKKKLIEHIGSRTKGGYVIKEDK